MKQEEQTGHVERILKSRKRKAFSEPMNDEYNMDKAKKTASMAESTFISQIQESQDKLDSRRSKRKPTYDAETLLRLGVPDDVLIYARETALEKYNQAKQDGHCPSERKEMWYYCLERAHEVIFSWC